MFMQIQNKTSYFTTQYTNNTTKASEFSCSFSDILSKQKNTISSQPLDQLRDQYIPTIPMVSPDSTVEISNQNINIIETTRYRLAAPEKVPLSQNEYGLVGDFSILDKETGYVTPFCLDNLKIQVDEKSGKRFLVSADGSNIVGALQVDNEMENFLSQLTEELGVDLKTVPAEGFSVYIGSTDIPCIMLDNGISFLPNYLQEDSEKLNAAMVKWMDIFHNHNPLLPWQARVLAQREAMGELTSLPDGGYISFSQNGALLYDRGGNKVWQFEVDKEQYPETDFRKYTLQHFEDKSKWIDIEFWKGLIGISE